MAKTGYSNGSDVLLFVDGKAIGHCTTHTTTYTSETKQRAVKPTADKDITSGLWTSTGVTGLSISISAEGLKFYDETECGYRELLAYWKQGKSITLMCMEREEDDNPYLKGQFVISSLEETAPAQDDVTYSVNFDNDGEPEILDESAITENAA